MALETGLSGSRPVVDVGCMGIHSLCVRPCKYMLAICMPMPTPTPGTSTNADGTW